MASRVQKEPGREKNTETSWERQTVGEGMGGNREGKGGGKGIQQEERDKASLRAKGIEGTREGLPWQSSG